MDTTKLFELTIRSFRDLVATLLTDDRVPESLSDVINIFKSGKSNLGRKEFAARLGLHVEELALFERSLSEFAKRNRDDAKDSSNNNIACLRLMSWLETVESRVADYQLDSEIASNVSEDLSRKQVRALELVIRSLVGERHGGQNSLANHLQQVFGERTVDRWTQMADPEDLLSGTTFSELASIFVNKTEFEHHQKLYEDADVVNLLNERRKTVQSFLEDIRRIRNTLAHNKKVSDVQLSLLDLYYDQLITPVQRGYSKGQTKVDPQSFLEVTNSQVDEYFSDLKQDVMSVKDDINDLKHELNQRFDNVLEQGQQISATANQVNKKLILALALLIPIALAAAYGIYVNQGTNESVNKIEQNSKIAKQNTETIVEKSDEVLKAQAELNDKAAGITSAIGEMATTTDKIALSTERVESSTARVEESTNRLEKSTERIAESNKEILDTVATIAKSSDKISHSIENIQQGFQTLAQSGGIISDPKLPQEVYYNARLYEQRGDYANARKSYIQFFDFKLELVDPHLRFQSFLKLQEGLEGAREIYRSLERKNGDYVTRFASLLLEPSEVRTARLTNFAEQHPNFAPVFFALSQEFSIERLGTQDAGDIAEEKQHLEMFLELKEQGNFVRFMLDKSLADEQLNRAEERLNRLARMNQAALENPVSLTGMMSNSGWMITIQVTGNPKEIMYRTDPASKFKSTGHMQVKNFTTGNLMPNMTVNLATTAGPTKFEVKYIDANDKERGPFEIEFEPESELIASQKKILEMLPQSWASFNDVNSKTLVYFSHLLAYRNAIKEIWYGLDKETPDTLYKIAIMTDTGIVEHAKEFDQGDRNNPGAIQENEMPFFAIPRDTKFITIKLNYLDGTESEVVRIKR